MSSKGDGGWKKGRTNRLKGHTNAHGHSICCELPLILITVGIHLVVYADLSFAADKPRSLGRKNRPAIPLFPSIPISLERAGSS